MSRIQELSILAVKDACHRYWVDKDISGFCENLTILDIPLIGIREASWPGIYMVISEHYNAYEQSETSCLIFAKLALKDTKDEDDEFVVNVTVLCSLIDNNIKFVSVHSSRDDDKHMISAHQQQAYSYYRKSLAYVFDVILEYQLVNNEFTYDRDRYRELFQVNTNFLNMDQWFWHMCTESIHPEDAEKMDIFRDLDIRKRISTNNNIIDINVRIKNTKKDYIWVKLTVLFIPNKRGTNIDRVFVFMKNIDDEMQEKMNTLTMAREDSLTGIWNRYYTEKLINKHLLKEKSGIFVLLDVDSFKRVNDSYGHITGDEILVNITRRVTNVISNDDVFGRIGGDEFVLFLTESKTEKENMARISSVLKAIQFDYSEYGLNMSIHCSAGVTNVGEKKDNFTALYGIADKALYEAKAAGRNTFRFL